MARCIQAQAVRRRGELLKKIPSATGQPFSRHYCWRLEGRVLCFLHGQS